MPVKLIVGLGNIGPKYTNNRHNIGFMALDNYQQARNWPVFSERTKLEAFISEKNTTEGMIVLAKPTTLMNNSGHTVQKLMQEYKCPLGNVLVVHDELALPFSTVRVRMEGSSAGHNGIESVIENIGKGFIRLRIGVAGKDRESVETSHYVLDDFNSLESNQLQDILDNSAEFIDKFMNDQLNSTTVNSSL